MAFGELPLEASQQLAKVGVPGPHVLLRLLPGDAHGPADFSDAAAFPSEPVYQFEGGAFISGQHATVAVQRCPAQGFDPFLGCVVGDLDRETVCGV